MNQNELFDEIRGFLLKDGIPTSEKDTAAAVLKLTGEEVPRKFWRDQDGMTGRKNWGDTYNPETDNNDWSTLLMDIDTSRRAVDESTSSGRTHVITNMAYLGNRSTTWMDPLREMWGDFRSYFLDQLNFTPSLEHVEAFKEFYKIVTKKQLWAINTMRKFHKDWKVEHAWVDMPDYWTIHNIVLDGAESVYANDAARGKDSISFPLAFSFAADMGMETHRHHGSMTFNIRKYRDLIRETVEELTVEGWELITVPVTMQRNGEEELVIGAISPAAAGTQEALTFFPLKNHSLAAAIAVELLYRLHLRSNTEEQIVSDRALASFNLINQARAACENINARKRDLEGLVKRRNEQVEQHRATLASVMRTVHEEQQELNQIMAGSTNLAIENLMSLQKVPQLLETMKGIKECGLEVDGRKLRFTFITHEYGMKAKQKNCGHYDGYDDNGLCVTCQHDPNHEYILHIPSIKFSINPGAREFKSAVMIRKFDDTEDPNFHPHMHDYGVCWGTAANPLAEAWARKDWESFTRVLLSWNMFYNDESPHMNASTFAKKMGELPKSGWHIPDQTQDVTVEVTLEELAADVPAAVAPAATA